jgi:predicted DNA-binding protein
MPKTGQYDRELRIYVTDEMHGFLKLLAERHGTNTAEEVRQAIREHLDVQEDVIGSRSRLGRRVMHELEQLQQRLLGQIAYQGKLQLAATIVLLAEQGLSGREAVRRIDKLANSPELAKIVRTK